MIRRLLGWRGPKFPIILNDNIAYGFWRNLPGMKGAALALAVCAFRRIVKMMNSNTLVWAIVRNTPSTQTAAVVLSLGARYLSLPTAYPLLIWSGERNRDPTFSGAATLPGVVLLLRSDGLLAPNPR